MGQRCLTADTQSEIPSSEFWFVADSASVATAAEALADHYRVSVFVPDSVATKTITGTLRGADLQQSLDVLAFFAGVAWRQSGSVYYFGGEEPAQFLTIPSAGVDVAAVRSVLGECVIVGDSVVIKTNPTQFAQLREVLEKLRNRPVMKVRCAVVDVSSSRLPAFRNFLNTGGAGITISGDLASKVSIKLPVDLRAVLDFFQHDEDAEMKLDTVFAIPSGEPLKLTSGEVVERSVYRRQDADGARDLITGFDRLQLGLSVELKPFYFENRWFLRFHVEDADMTSEKERRLTLSGSYEVESGAPVMLASVQRTKDVQTEKRVPGLHRIPAIGRAFRSKSSEKEARSVMVFLELLE